MAKKSISKKETWALISIVLGGGVIAFPTGIVNCNRTLSDNNWNFKLS